MRPFILPADETQEFFFKEGCFILEMANSPEDPECSIARARVPAGKTTRWHLLAGISERYVILRGKGRVEMDELPPAVIGPGDVVRIPPGCRQRIANTGRTDLVFLAICTPRFRPEAYRDMQE